MKTLLLVLLTALSLPAAATPPTPPAATAAVREVEIRVHDGAYHPASIEVKAGTPLRLRFLKTDHDGCTREVVLWTGERRTLPTGQPVVVEVGAPAPGRYPFTCGMGMVKGAVVVLP